MSSTTFSKRTTRHSALQETRVQLTGFHASKRRDISRVSIPRGLSYAKKIRVFSYKFPIVDLFQITNFNFKRKLLNMAIYFLSCFLHSNHELACTGPNYLTCSKYWPGGMSQLTASSPRRIYFLHLTFRYLQ